MEINSTKKSYIALYTIAGILLVSFIIPFKIPFSVKTMGKVLPIREWVISKGPDGRLITILTNNKTGMSKNYTVSQFERGDAIQFKLNPDIISGKAISKNDTIAVLYSNEIDRQIAELKGQLDIANASLIMYSSGEKEPVIQELTNKVEYLKTQAAEQNKIYNRKKSLYEKKLISQEEYDIAKSTMELNNINIVIAEAQLKTGQSGAKQEQIGYIKSQIISLKNQIDVLKKRTDQYTLLSQINGLVRRKTSGDTLLIVSDTSEYVIIMPVKWEERNYIFPGQKIEVSFSSSKLVPEAKLYRFDNTVYTLSGRQVFLVFGYADKNISEFAPGLLIECSIKCGDVSPLEYLKRLF